MIEHLTNDNYAKHINGNTNCVIDFSATWCGPCKMIKPVYEELSNLCGNYSKSNLHFYCTDVDNDDEIAEKYNITCMPTFVFIHNGKEVHRILGLFEKQDFIKNLNKFY